MVTAFDTVYNISYFPNITEFYKLKPQTREELTFYRKTSKKWALAVGKYDHIHLTQSGVFDTKIKFSYLNVRGMRGVRYFVELNWVIRVVGGCRGVGKNIDWQWIQANDCSKAFLLIDKRKEDIVLAKMNGLTLDNNSNGSLYILPSLPKEYLLTVATSACLVLRLMDQRSS
ncbi:hypothetical protein CONCODRAFT_72044 [Conidiobolus coronatus NRRL 28638]|uniref:Uncharacterized protein n=1 Tax=Conidiobolus coronatus (strain ATCC 28846 / CBS 209.66 / NRRL 28638) TaxID=796925 RepID=A0A137P0Y8_CONC2|nr:hypothetical protein CONCODRAFT_72044 [Conidiobolus coronatus NRRL 28638]|eukprot:KXN68730.1 hypothetical protein CONCODRAFT_72044 [Conidiobolus coronatus NRRL 28638]